MADYAAHPLRAARFARQICAASPTTVISVLPRPLTVFSMALREGFRCTGASGLSDSKDAGGRRGGALPTKHAPIEGKPSFCPHGMAYGMRHPAAFATVSPRIGEF